MSNKEYTAYDVIKIAGEMEKRGANIYQELGEAARQRTIAEIFKRLAEEKTKQLQKYNKLLEKVIDEEPQEAYPGEYILYLRNLAEEHTLNLKKAKKALTKINTPEEAIDFIITLKKSSLLYLQELRQYVHPEDISVVAELVKMKQAGLNQLIDLKKKYQQLFALPSKKPPKKPVKKKKKLKKIKKAKKSKKKKKKK